MDSILKSLFLSDIRFAQGEEFKHRCSGALSDVLRSEEKLRAELTQKQWGLVKDHLEWVQLYHSLDCQLEFERGFLWGSRLMLEILSGRLRAT